MDTQSARVEGMEAAERPWKPPTHHSKVQTRLLHSIAGTHSIRVQICVHTPPSNLTETKLDERRG